MAGAANLLRRRWLLKQIETPIVSAVSSKALAETSEHRPQQAALLQKLGERCFMWTNLLKKDKHGSKETRKKEIKDFLKSNCKEVGFEKISKARK